MPRHHARIVRRHATAPLLLLFALASFAASCADDDPAAREGYTSTARDDDAQIVATNLPDTLRCGETFDASVTVRNAGRALWTADLFKLGAVGDQDPLRPGDPRVYLPADATVPPGGTFEFHFELTAPASPGRAHTDWQMVHEGVRWFGAIAARDVTITCEGDPGGPPGDPPAAPPPDTLAGRVIVGYQGWFACPGDGGPDNAWVHWFRDGVPDADRATFDLWPDTSALDPSERCPTNMTLSDGSPAMLFSSQNPATVQRHFRWMAQHGIDGVLLQRFTSELGDPRALARRDHVLELVRAAAEANGRVFAVEYDISGNNPATVVDDLRRDWAHLVHDLGVTASPRYLHHRGRPLLAVWGFGFNDRPGTPADAHAVIDWFKRDAPADELVTLLGGVPAQWRTLEGASRTEPEWAGVYRAYDIINPWSVGAYATDAQVDDFRRRYVDPDLAEARRVGAEYMPVVFPGFSWHNLNGGPVNMIPRRGGQLLWRQVYNVVSAGAPFVFAAMFDEVDEGTALLPAINSRGALPREGAFLSLDADGQTLPNDWYLQLAGAAQRMLRHEIPLTATIPLHP